jgi:hypothetical protein
MAPIRWFADPFLMKTLPLLLLFAGSMFAAVGTPETAKEPKLPRYQQREKIVAGMAAYRETAAKLVQSVQTVVPKGWSVSYDEARAMLSVRRDENPVVRPIAAANVGPGRANDIEAHGQKPEEVAFELELSPRPTPEAYAAMKEKNRLLAEKSSALHDKLKKMGVEWSDRSQGFAPRGEEQKTVVREFESLKEDFLELPDYFFKEVSLKWNGWTTSWDAAFRRVVDENIGKECDTLHQELVRFLKPYAPEQR